MVLCILYVYSICIFICIPFVLCMYSICIVCVFNLYCMCIQFVLYVYLVLLSACLGLNSAGKLHFLYLENLWKQLYLGTLAINSIWETYENNCIWEPMQSTVFGDLCKQLYLGIHAINCIWETYENNCIWGPMQSTVFGDPCKQLYLGNLCKQLNLGGPSETTAHDIFRFSFNRNIY